jgi:hypothetical protein
LKKNCHFVDSAIVRAHIQKESYVFGKFVANRVAEIQSKPCKSDGYWIPSDKSPAYFTARVTPPSLLDSESVWQKGPEILYNHLKEWPIKQDCEVKEIPYVLMQYTEMRATEEENPRVSQILSISTEFQH